MRALDYVKNLSVLFAIQPEQRWGQKSFYTKMKQYKEYKEYRAIEATWPQVCQSLQVVSS